jgi:uncharacterized protein YggT (Ycf19 family)
MPAISLFSFLPYPLGMILSTVIQFYVILIVVWAVLSWFNQQGSGFVNEIYVLLDRIVEPFVGLFRRFIPTMGGLDFSPLIAIIVLQIVFRLLA